MLVDLKQMIHINMIEREEKPRAQQLLYVHAGDLSEKVIGLRLVANCSGLSIGGFEAERKMTVNSADFPL